jgi:hypothetical protein
MATPPRETSEERLAAAQAMAAAAADVAAAREDQERTKASRAKLTKLLKLDPAARFEALGDEANDLVSADRRRLVKSLKGQTAPTRRVVPGGTASRWAVFRSRLPYRRRGLVLTGLSVAWVVTAGAMAWSNTPLAQVESVFPQDVAVVFTLANGVVVGDRLTPREVYGLMRNGNGEAVLRKWVPGVGYAQAHVPADWVRWH